MKNEMTSFKKKLDSLLEEFLEDKYSSALANGRNSAQMIETIRDFTLRGGKRIRPAMMYYSYLCFSGEKKEEIMKTSMSLEFVQDFLLIHDDIMDQDDLRRGRPTVHKIYEKISQDKHYGTSMAILVGDLSVCFANEIITDSDFKSELKIKALKIMNDIVGQVIYGQELDINSKYSENNEEQILKIFELKTSTYTFLGPLLIGATLAGAKEKDLKSFYTYSQKLGQAFQIQDDILGLFSDEKRLGKPVGSDMKEGKKTLLITKTLEKASKAEKIFLEKNLGNTKITKKQLDKIKNIVTKNQALDYCQKLIKNLVTEAKQSIETENLKKEGKDFLLGVADYMLKRSY